MQKPIHQFKEEKTQSFVSRNANWTQQWVCKSHSSDRNLIQCFQCNLVSVMLFLFMPCRHSGEWRFSSTYTKPQHYSKWTWMVCFMPGHPHAHWTGGWGGNQNWHGHIGIKKNLFPCQESNYDTSAFKPVAYSMYQLCCLSSVWYLHPLKCCTVHTAANFITIRLKNAVNTRL